MDAITLGQPADTATVGQHSTRHSLEQPEPDSLAIHSSPNGLPPPPIDKYNCMIRHILHRDSRLSSLSSSTSSSNIGSDGLAIPSTASSQASTEIAIDDGLPPLPRDSLVSHTSILLPEPTSSTGNRSSVPFIETPRRASHRASIPHKVYDYSHRIQRYLPLLKLLVVSLLLLLSGSLFYLFGFDISQKQTWFYILFAWAIPATYYLFYSTFKRWFYAWDPDFSLTRPA